MTDPRIQTMIEELQGIMKSGLRNIVEGLLEQKKDGVHILSISDHNCPFKNFPTKLLVSGLKKMIKVYEDNPEELAAAKGLQAWAEAVGHKMDHVCEDIADKLSKQAKEN